MLASELDKEEPPCGRHASGRDETLNASGRDEALASELSLDGLYEISFYSFVGLKKLSYNRYLEYIGIPNCVHYFYDFVVGIQIQCDEKNYNPKIN